MNYFIGIVPPDEYRQQLISFQNQWRNNRVVDHVEPHITVKAPNRLTPDRKWLDGVKEECEQIHPFKVSLGKPGFFGDQVVFLSVQSQEIYDLHRRLVKSIAPSVEASRDYFELDNYTPHLTLGQTRYGLTSTELIEMAEKAQLQLVPYPTFTVTYIRIYQKNEKKRYETYLDLPLGI